MIRQPKYVTAGEYKCIAVKIVDARGIESLVDLRTLQDLSRYFRQQVIQEAEVHYAQG